MNKGDFGMDKEKNTKKITRRDIKKLAEMKADLENDIKRIEKLIKECEDVLKD